MSESASEAPSSFLPASRSLLKNLPATGILLKPLWVIPGNLIASFGLCDYKDSGKCICIFAVAKSVVVVPVSVQEIANGLLRPLTDLSDVLASRGWEIAGVHDQDRIGADDDGGVALRKLVRRVGMADLVNALRQLSDGALLGSYGIRQCGRSRKRQNQNGTREQANEAVMERHGSSPETVSGSADWLRR